MARYIEDDSDSGHTLLVTAGVVAGLVAGALVAQRLGGWRGVRRLLAGRRAPLLKVIRAAIPSGTLASVLDVVGFERLVSALVGDARAGLRGRLDARVRDRRRGFSGAPRRPDPDLDEIEVDDFERAAAGLDDEDERDVVPPPLRAPRARPVAEDDLDDEAEDELEASPSPEAVEEAVLAAFRRHPVLRQRALEIAVDDDGILELTGWVRSERELRIARRVAARVDGVERVIVDVAVRDGMRPSPRAGVSAPEDADEDDVADARAETT